MAKRHRCTAWFPRPADPWRAFLLGAALTAASVATAIIQHVLVPRPGPADPAVILAAALSGAYAALHAGLCFADPPRRRR